MAKDTRHATSRASRRYDRMHDRKNQDCNVNERPVLVSRPRRADGVGDALRAAFHERLGQAPAEMRALLDRLR